MSRIRLDSERSVPCPVRAGEAAWRAIHAPQHLTRADQMILASVADHYSFLLEMTNKDSSECLNTTKRVIRMREAGITEQDIHETMPPSIPVT